MLATFFRDHWAMRERIVELLKDDRALLFDAYFKVAETHSVWDYEGKLFNSLQNIDGEFTLKYIQWFRDWHRRHCSANRRESEIDFSVLWMRDDYEEIIDKAFLMLSQDFVRWEHPNLEDLLQFKGWTDADAELAHSRQQDFLHKFIEQNAQNFAMMEWLFSSLSWIANNSITNYLAVFLRYNIDYELFEKLPMEPTMSSWSGSKIPMIQARIASLEDLRNPLDPMKYVKHRRRIDEDIKHYQWEVEYEKRKEWARNWYS